jgi:hypothetical protein
VPANLATLRLGGETAYELTRVEGAERTSLGRLTSDGALVVSLPPRKVVVLEAAPSLEQR